MGIGVEIERKFVIMKPDMSKLESIDGYSSSDIDQTYLTSDPGVTRRVRSRRYGKCTVYTETKKTRVDEMSSLEDEKELEKQEYEILLGEIKEGTSTIRKTRITFKHLSRVFEVDVYPEWTRTCILEVELPSRDEVVEIPDFITVVEEVTGDKRYSNAAMAHKFPDELI